MFRAVKKAIKNKTKRKAKKPKSISLFNRPEQFNNLLTIFPVEVLLHILSFLPPDTLKVLSVTSCFLHVLSRDSGLVNLMVRRHNQANLCKIPASCEATGLSFFSSQIDLKSNHESAMLTLLKEKEGKQFFFIEFLENNFPYILRFSFENLAKKSRVQASYITEACVKKHLRHQDLIKTLEIPFSSKEIELRLKDYLQKNKLTRVDGEDPISWMQQFLLINKPDKSFSPADARVRLYIQESFNEFKLSTGFEVNTASVYQLPTYFNRR